MSNQESSHTEEPPLRNRVFTFIGFSGCILLFVFILLIVYVPNRPDPVNQEEIAQREAHLRDAMRGARAKLESYEALNAEEGVFRIPIERAMDRVVEEAWRDPRGVRFFGVEPDANAEPGEAEGNGESAEATIDHENAPAGED